MRWAPRHLDDIGLALLQHLFLVGVSIGCAFVIAMILGVWSARRPKTYALVLTLTGMLFSIPSLALFALLIPWLGIGPLPAIVGLTAYALMILVRNIATGFHAIAPEVLDAARGMGYGYRRMLWEIELPLALPFIITGLRIATTTLIGIATVAAYINAGGLGAIIFAGLDQRYPEKILIGGALTSLLAIGVDALFLLLQRRLARRRRLAPSTEANA
ncbi:ABC transporter permease [Brenneria sp. g21c3]|uniref:ABC transporter permease n=1 Tax=Brenneria corticis TaxID=2173106 RepID=A0A2U1UCV4_9GAMM|nr:ABC transporter permease [Brenneria sp. CFCC 11842]MEE3663016.1 ABC transporter permease [Brenneria sp. g21c3]PWC19488.1 ABC transporter permease [Brenneria sp. CFCC 11842]